MKAESLPTLAIVVATAVSCEKHYYGILYKTPEDAFEYSCASVSELLHLRPIRTIYLMFKRILAE